MKWTYDLITDEMYRVNKQLKNDWNECTYKFVTEKMNYLLLMEYNDRSFAYYFLNELESIRQYRISVDELKKYTVEEVCYIIKDLYVNTYVSANKAFYEDLCSILEELGITDGRTIFKGWDE